VKAPHRETALRVTPELVALYMRRARRLHREACRSVWRAVWAAVIRGEAA
jgi:hypothetical protein